MVKGTLVMGALVISNKDMGNKDKKTKQRFDELVNPTIKPQKRVGTPTPLTPARRKK